MIDKEKLKIIRKIIDDTFYMCIRYAHGNHAGAAQIVRLAIIKLKKVFPDFKLRPDYFIHPPTPEQLAFPGAMLDDYLDDLFQERSEEYLERLRKEVAKLRKKRK